MATTKTKVRPAVFMSLMREQWVIVKQGWDENTPYGRTRHHPKIAEFTDHRFDADENTARKMGMTLEELQEGLRQHSQNRDHEFCTDPAFWEVAAEVFAPPADDALLEIANLTASNDVDGLVQLLEAERDGFGREKVILACEGVLERLTAS